MQESQCMIIIMIVADAPISGLMSESVDVNPQRPFPSRRSQQQGDPHLGWVSNYLSIVVMGLNA